MQANHLSYLRCPISRQELEIKVIETKQKQYIHNLITEVHTAILYSPIGFVFPVINGIPRMQIESIISFDFFWKTNLPNYEEIKYRLLNEYGDIIKACYKKNEATRKSFSFEWSLLKRDNSDKIWHNTRPEMQTELLAEIDQTDLNNKLIVDIGCGHGVSSSIMADLGATVVGLDLSFSIEEAYEHLQNPNIFLIQADLQFPPLENKCFDIVYSSGVIHHTNNTELSFGVIQNLVKLQGNVTIWLYHPIQSFIHNTVLFIRKISVHIPPRLLFWIFLFTLLPMYKVVLFFKGKKFGWREIMIDLLDAFTPRYRYEHSHNESLCWYAKMGFEKTKVTNTNLFGFSISGIKQ
jgi:SAM-dependent methyltransferase